MKALPKFRKRVILIGLLSLSVFLCFAAGVYAYSHWLEAGIQTTVREQVLADNIQTAKQLARLIDEMELADLDQYDSWDRLQSVVEDIELPNDGFVCVVDSSSGFLLCHPMMRNVPSLRDVAVGKCKIEVDGAPQTILSASEQANRVVTGGLATIDGETQVVAVAYMPQFEANVLVHQRDTGIQKATERMMLPVRSIGYGVASAVAVVVLVVSLLVLQRYESRVALMNESLEVTVQDRTKSLMKTRNAVIFGLAKLAESRDTDTGHHLDRIRSYVTVLATSLSTTHPVLKQDDIEDLALASSLHDIGKVGIPDEILLKPGAFTKDERNKMELHSSLGGACLQSIQEQLGDDDFLAIAKEIAFFHHEKWNGAGYPSGKAGTEIPLPARIVALADVYDALTSKRPYKKAMPHSKVREIIIDGRGTHFDPQVVDAFLRCESEFRAIAGQQEEPSPVVDLPLPTSSMPAQV